MPDVYSFHSMIIQVIQRHELIRISSRMRLHALYAITGQKEIRWTLTMISRDGQCPRARGHMLRIFMTLPSLYRPDYVPLKYDFTLTRYTSWRCCNHCATRVETRDHQRSLSLTNRIWHRIVHVDRPSVSVNAMHVQCRRKQKGTGFSILSVVATSMRSSKGARFECLCC